MASRTNAPTSPAAPSASPAIPALDGDGPAILERARAAAPVLRDEAAASEAARQLTPRAVEALRATGAFRMPMPRAWGGPEVDIPAQFAVVEELARADGSAGWCAMIAAGAGFFRAALPDEVADALYPDLDGVTAGFVQAPVGRLDVVDGGYLLSGRWPFGSGCTHAAVIMGGGLLFDGGELVVTADGRPENRIAALPADRFEILDTWYPGGLAGSGSHDYTIEGAFVPAEQTFVLDDLGGRREGPLYAWPGLFLHLMSAVPLGVARAALETAEELLGAKVYLPDMRRARDDARVRTAIGRAHALVGSARAHVVDVIGDFWATLVAGDPPSPRQRAAFGSANVHAFLTCHEAAQLLVDTVGSAAVYRSCPLERQLRDLTTMRQHVGGQLKLLEIVGGLWFDEADLDHPLLTHHIL
jgi:alkylation response protein AidB-like acyl-CoA dehydrogenase